MRGGNHNSVKDQDLNKYSVLSLPMLASLLLIEHPLVLDTRHASRGRYGVATKTSRDS